LVSSKSISARQQTFENKMNLTKVLTGIDCGDKECFLRHEMKKKCVLFLHTNNTDCEIPCKLDGCDTEVHSFMNCPIWECNLFTNNNHNATDNHKFSRYNNY
jgi:hypothetical protein